VPNYKKWMQIQNAHVEYTVLAFFRVLKLMELYPNFPGSKISVSCGKSCQLYPWHSVGIVGKQICSIMLELLHVKKAYPIAASDLG
jgi:hypothetical protein